MFWGRAAVLALSLWMTNAEGNLKRDWLMQYLFVPFLDREKFSHRSLNYDALLLPRATLVQSCGL